MNWWFHDVVPDGPHCYTQAVVGDRFPVPISPLTATAGVAGHLGGSWTALQVELGLRKADAPPNMAPASAMFGGRLFIDDSALRQLGMYGDGIDPVGFIQQFCGNRPDVSRRRIDPLPDAKAEWISRWTDHLVHSLAPATGEQTDARARRFRSVRSQLARLAPAKLVTRLAAARDELAEIVPAYLRAELAVGLSQELVRGCVEQAGHPTVAGELVPGPCPSDERLGGTLWELSRLVRSRTLDRYFEADPAPVRLGPDGQLSDRFRQLLDQAQACHGHLGPGEWELSGPTWTTDVGLPLAVVGLLRTVDDDLRPRARSSARAARMVHLAEPVRRTLRLTPKCLARFECLLGRAAGAIHARNDLREAVASSNHRLRLTARALGQHGLDAGLLDATDQIFMIQFAELGQWLDEPRPLSEQLRMRSYDYHALAALEAPFATTGPPTPPTRWPSVHRETTSNRLPAGLVGTPVSSGAASGPARVIRDAAEVGHTAPGDILVIPDGGHRWTPLLPAFAAVVSDTASQISEVAIACRELSVPCIGATVDATRKIPQGKEIRVAAANGSVQFSDK